MAEQFQPWKDAFLQHLQKPSVAAPLKDAATSGHLMDWTACLTGAVVRSCEALGWHAAGKGHPLDLLPQMGQEYLGIDAMAFVSASAGRWPFPLAAFELENSKADDRVAYSLWKVLCLRARFRVVFAYRPDWEQGRKLVHDVCADVIGTIPPDQRAALKGETVVAVGNRGEGATFPDGYFKFWMLDTNLGRFHKV
ncbi:hypothetical protein J8F10_30115 [Gemmata sp. G18]|uniref:Uncharacterized protein n=1 Tax=Gemmata palustris TaxID=2822762 RepID=A0ABS5C0K5_9BACT|nr:hypothetical protein [Gemmata palustris]MBP3959521.1 hypothetical protein [Gemmata palustris]